MDNIVYKRADGGVSVITPAPKETLEKALGKMTEQEYIDHVYSRSIPQDAKEIFETTSFPNDKYFRDAWTIKNKQIDVDMPKARIIHMDRIRKDRDKKLKELDIDTLRGKDVQSHKQYLRDIPQTLDLTQANTPEELKSTLPKEYKNPTERTTK